MVWIRNPATKRQSAGVMTSRERVLKALNYEPVDRAPVDMGGTYCSGAHVSVVAKVRQALGIG